MNRKKITLLLTGLVVASTMMTGCTSSSDKANDSSKVAQNESGFKRATDRTVTEYTGDGYNTNTPYGQYPATNYQENQSQIGSYPDVAYADDIAGDLNVQQETLDNEITNNVNDSTIPNNSITNNEGMNGTTSFDTTSPDYEMTPSDEIITNDNVNSFQNTTTMDNQISGFNSAVLEENFGTIDTQTRDIQSGVSSSTDSIQSGISSTTGMKQTSETQSSTNVVSDVTTTEDTDNQRDIQIEKTDIAPQVRTGKENINLGEITVVKAVGGSDIVGTTSQVTQGTIGLSFKLPQEAITNAGLDSLMQSAYEETINDANNSFEGKGNVTERQKLVKALQNVFKCDTKTLNLTFKDPQGTIVEIPFKGEVLFQSNRAERDSDYVRHIIDLTTMRNGSIRGGRSTRTSSSDIVLRMVVKNTTIANVNGTGNDELKTNTMYTFAGITGTNAVDNNIPLKDVNGTGDVGYITNFNIPTATTGKEASILQATDSKTGTKTVIKEETTQTDKFDQSANPTAITTKINNVTGLYSTTINSTKQFLDMTEYMKEATNVIPGGNNIKFTNINFKDKDNSIVKIEMEDNKGTKYPCSLVDIGTDDNNYYLQVNGLKADTRYTFSKIYITSDIMGREETDVIELCEYDSTSSQSPKVKPNTIQIITTNVTEPKIELGAQVTGDVTLPDGLKVRPVKNDATALRYIVKVDNPEGNLGELKVNGLRDGEKSNVEKRYDKKSKTNYYIVTLTDLARDTDYGFVTLELTYKDLDGGDRVTRQSLSNINATGNDVKTDNRTEKTELTGTEAVNVILNTKNTSNYARFAKVPVFIDDIYSRITSTNFTAPDNPDVNVELVDNYLDITGLKPESTTNINLDFNYTDANGTAQKLTKYITITTKKVADVDVSRDLATVTGNDVSIKFDYYTTPKQGIKSVIVRDENNKELKGTWNGDTNTLILEDLEASKEYKNLVATFTLNNTLTVDYPLTPFTTEKEIVKPTGKVADFVRRVYTIALGREPEVEGWNFWINKLTAKEISVTEFIAENLMTQPEFVDQELSKTKFVTKMYSLIVNREADQEGRKYWEKKYDEYKQTSKTIAELRIKIAREMMDQPEFKELVTNIGLKY